MVLDKVLTIRLRANDGRGEYNELSHRPGEHLRGARAVTEFVMGSDYDKGVLKPVDQGYAQATTYKNNIRSSCPAYHVANTNIVGAVSQPILGHYEDMSFDVRYLLKGPQV